MYGLRVLLPACRLFTCLVSVAISSDLPVCVPTHGPYGLEIYTALAALALCNRIDEMRFLMSFVDYIERLRTRKILRRERNCLIDGEAIRT
jgi:hypothetical protein